MRIRDLCEINSQSLNSDIIFETYEYLDTGNITKNVIDEIQVFNNKNELPSRAKRLVRQGDILISTVRPNQLHYGILENPKDNLIVSTGFAVLSPKSNLVNNYYLYYYLTQEKVTKFLQMLAESSVSAYPSITPDVIGNIEINLPSLKIQNKVVESIHIFDKKISLNLHFATTLKEYSQLLFHKWFVDFNFPNEKGKSYKDNGGKMHEVDGKLIPVGWEIDVITSLGEIISGGTPSKSNSNYFCDFGIPWITPKDLSLTSNKYIERGAIDITDEGLKNSSAKLIPKGTVLMSSRAPIGYLAISKNDVTTNQGFKSIVPNPSVGSEFVYYTLKRMMPKIEKISSGSTFKEVSKEMLSKLEVLKPEDSVLSKYQETMKVLSEKIVLLEEETEILINTRDLLIKKLFS
ncbi:restriction endonuclease subunit S [Bacillus thuringiensis]|uniref:restriction endonuclease subunit S n=1 Tax=Bacillus thuringiensis TaxID=1428 RepID=UPI000BFC3B88|nr:restriction endonuclease subunit S [Bacillus thuringiensis]PGO90184.1 restriction endonuclease subunit S [Bacillus thuringiensis]